MAVKFSSTMEIAAPPDSVFDAFVEIERAGEWMPNVARIDRLDDGPMRVGSEWRETRTMMRREATEQFEVTELLRPTRFGLRVDGRKGSMGRGEFRFLYVLEPTEKGTRLTLEGEVEMPGLFFKLFAKLLVLPFRKGCESDLKALARHLERQPALA
jgi:carbon monoxide dehydrogenase subunit G